MEGELPAWTARMEVDLGASVRASGENAGHLEELIARHTREVARLRLEEAVQAKADRTPPRCPACRQALHRKKAGAARSFESRFGSITFRRTRGWCRKCHAWRYR
jgi:hypothetical protein